MVTVKGSFAKLPMHWNFSSSNYFGIDHEHPSPTGDGDKHYSWTGPPIITLQANTWVKLPCVLNVSKNFDQKGLQEPFFVNFVTLCLECFINNAKHITKTFKSAKQLPVIQIKSQTLSY